MVAPLPAHHTRHHCRVSADNRCDLVDSDRRLQITSSRMLKRSLIVLWTHGSQKCNLLRGVPPYCIQCHIIAYHIILYHIISYHIISYHTSLTRSMTLIFEQWSSNSATTAMFPVITALWRGVCSSCVYKGQHYKIILTQLHASHPHIILYRR